MSIFDQLKHKKQYSSAEYRWRQGEVFGQTRFIVRDIKEGGMGIVYIIANPKDSRELFAAKTFKDEYLSDEAAIMRFWHEAQTWVELQRHKNLVYADHIFEIEGKPYIFLEYVDGGSIRDLLRRQKLNLEQSIDIAIQFCTGMEAVRKMKGLVHRDIKPENCLITNDGIIKITDWGLSAVVSSQLMVENPPTRFSIFQSVSTMTKEGSIIGTPAYMAPEQWEGKKADTRTDIYSFGCMLYEAIKGSPPFEGSALIELKAKHIGVNPLPLSGIPGTLSQIVLKCLEKNPQERFPNFEAVGSALLTLESQNAKNSRIFQRVETGKYSATSSELTQKGFSMLHLRRDKEAIDYFRKAIGLAPDNFLALGYMGYCYGNIDEHDKAIEACEMAIRINPRFAHAYANLGYSYSKKLEFEKSIESYHKAIQLAPNDVTHYQNMTNALNEWGEYTKDPSKFREGIKCADEGLRIDKRYYRLWVARGHSQLLLKEYNDAIESLQEALTINPRERRAFLLLAQCCYALGDRVKALQYISEAKKIDANFIT